MAAFLTKPSKDVKLADDVKVSTSQLSTAEKREFQRQRKLTKKLSKGQAHPDIFTLTPINNRFNPFYSEEEEKSFKVPPVFRNSSSIPEIEEKAAFYNKQRSKKGKETISVDQVAWKLGLLSIVDPLASIVPNPNKDMDYIEAIHGPAMVEGIQKARIKKRQSNKKESVVEKTKSLIQRTKQRSTPRSFEELDVTVFEKAEWKLAKDNVPKTRNNIHPNRIARTVKRITTREQKQEKANFRELMSRAKEQKRTAKLQRRQKRKEEAIRQIEAPKVAESQVPKGPVKTEAEESKSFDFESAIRFLNSRGFFFDRTSFNIEQYLHVCRLLEGFDILDLATHIFFFIHDLTRCERKAHYHAAVYRLLCALGVDGSVNKHILSYFATSLFRNCASFVSLFRRKPRKITEGEGEVDATWTTEYFEEAYATLVSNMSCSLVQTLQSVILGAVSFKLFSKDISKSLISVFGKPQKVSVFQFCASACEATLKLMKVKDALVNGVPFTEALLCSDPVTKVMKESKEILLYKDSLYTGLPSPGKICQKTFMATVQRNLAIVRAFKKRVGPLTTIGREIYKIEVELLVAERDVLANVQARRRSAPFAFYLDGPPGCGKSKTLPLLFAAWSHEKGRKFDDSHVYALIKSTTFMTGYDPFSNPIIHISEAGSTAPNIVKSRGDPSMENIMSMCDGLPMWADMAELEKKGKVPVMPELVGMDTNNGPVKNGKKGFNLEHLVSAPAAALRRLVGIRQRVHPDYMEAGSCRIDAAKSLASDTPIMDRYIFEIVRFDPVDNTNFVEKSILVDGKAECDIYGLVKTMSGLFREHIEREETLLHTFDKADCYDEYFPKDRIVTRPQLPSIPVTESEGADQNRSNNSERGVVPYEDLEEPSLSEQLSITVKTASGMGLDVLSDACGLVSNRFITLGLDYIPRPKITSVFEFVGFRICFIVSFIMVISSYFRIIPWSYTTMCILFTLLDPDAIFVSMSKQALEAKAKIKKNRLKVNWLRLKNYVNGETKQILESSFAIVNEKTLVAIGVGVTFFSIGAGIAYVVTPRPKKEEIDLDRMWHDEQMFREEFDAYYNQLKENSEKQTEAHTAFVMESPLNEELNALEESYHCGNSYKRIPVKNHHELYNVREIVPASIHKGSPMSLLASIAPNIRRCRVEGKTPINAYLLGVCEDYAIINTHSLAGSDTFLLHVSTTGSVDLKVNEKWKSSFIGATERTDLGNDVTLLRLSSMRFTDKLIHFPNNEKFPVGCAAAIGGTAVRAFYQKEATEFDDSRIGTFKVSHYWSYAWPDHKSGKCGLPLVIQKDAGSCIAGLHTGGAEGFGYGTVITRAMIVAGIEVIKARNPFAPIVSEGALACPVLTEAPIKSPFRYEELHGLTYFGKTPGKVLLNNKSRLRRTPFASDIQTFFFEKLDFISEMKYQPPLMQPTGKGENYRSPYNIALRGMNTQRKPLDTAIMAKVLQVLADRVISKLKEKGITKLDPLTIESAINGPEIDPFIKRINPTTSAGFTWNTKKENVIPIVDETQERVLREPIEELKERIKEVLDKYESGESANFVYTAQLKDEPRTHDKVKEGKTRVFYMPPIEAIVVARMFLAPFYSLMVEHGDVFCTTVGIAIHSDADRFVRELKAFSPYIMEGDYKSFDTTMPFDIGKIGNSLVYMVLKALGYNEKSLKVVMGLLSDNSFPYIMMLLELFLALAMQPSGKFATAEDNSLKNLIMLMYAWYYHPELRDHHFFDFVSPRTYGDDLLAAVKEMMKHLFNNNYYQKFCKEHYNMTYTSAAKSSDVEDFMTVETMSFLKRKFVFRESIQRWIPPLEMESIFRSLSWFIPSNHISEEQQLIDTMGSALWELYFHLEADKYHEVREYFITLASQQYMMARTEVAEQLPLYYAVEQRITA